MRTGASPPWARTNHSPSTLGSLTFGLSQIFGSPWLKIGRLEAIWFKLVELPKGIRSGMNSASIPG